MYNAMSVRHLELEQNTIHQYIMRATIQAMEQSHKPFLHFSLDLKKTNEDILRQLVGKLWREPLFLSWQQH